MNETEMDIRDMKDELRAEVETHFDATRPDEKRYEIVFDGCRWRAVK